MSKWIRNDKQRPEKSGYYIVTYVFVMDNGVFSKQLCHEIYFVEEEDKWYVDEDKEEFYFPVAVIAWMPLPEPYRYKKGGGE